MRGLRRSREWGIGLLLAVAISSGASPNPAEHSEIVVRGLVEDANGMAMAGYPVRLLKTKTILNILRWSTATQQMEEDRTTTDAKGRFEMRLVPDPKFDFFYLRFYDPKTFDPVKYQVPADLDISRRFKRGPEVVVHHVLKIHPEWPQVEKLVSTYGGDSNRGKILLSLGLPERREKISGVADREDWWYYSKGLCYQLRADQVLQLRRYNPVLPPPGRG